MEVGQAIVHSAFGTGTVVHVGDYKGDQAVWVDFDRGDRKMLDPTYASSHVRLRTRSDKATPASPSIMCDVCGGRPVVVTVAGPGGPEQFCEAHRNGS
ncbi:MAG: hypothetical protein M3Q48_14825 [Actinomycetota bacterium]|nr:hypothetical protein [Actinomycetota bacterium]